MADHRTIDRRTFLRGAAQAGVGVGLLSALPACAQGGDRPAPSNRVQMGFIGLGGMGTGNLRSFLGMSDVQVVAVCDVDANHAANAKSIVDKRYGNTDCVAYTDFRELLGRGDLDAMCQSTPDHWHAVPAILAARAGIDIYGEKPFTHTLAEGRALADTVKEYGRIWQTGSWQRSRAEFHRGCELVRNHRLGRIVRIEIGLPTGSTCKPVTFGDPPAELAYELWCGPSPLEPYCPQRVHYNWRHQLEYGGGKLMDWIGHHGDVAHWGMGWDDTGPEAVEGTGEFPVAGIYNAPVNYTIVETYADGTEMHISNKFHMGCKWIDEAGHWILADRGRLDAEPKSLLQERLGPDDVRLYYSRNHQRNFLDGVKTRQPTITPAETAHRSASIGHLGNIAMRVGRKIRWDPATETIQDDAEASRMLGNPLRSPWRL